MSVKRIKNLVKQLNEYRHAYYNQDAPLVSDAEYDRLFDELKKTGGTDWFHPVKFSDTDGWILSGQ